MVTRATLGQLVIHHAGQQVGTQRNAEHGLRQIDRTYLGGIIAHYIQGQDPKRKLNSLIEPLGRFDNIRTAVGMTAI